MSFTNYSLSLLHLLQYCGVKFLLVVAFENLLKKGRGSSVVLINLDTMKDKKWISLNFRKQRVWHFRRGDNDRKGALYSIVLSLDSVDEKIS